MMVRAILVSVSRRVGILLLQFWVFCMTRRVAIGFLLQVCSDGFVEVDACLVCQADEHKKDVGHFVGEIVGVV